MKLNALVRTNLKIAITSKDAVYKEKPIKHKTKKKKKIVPHILSILNVIRSHDIRHGKNVEWSQELRWLNLKSTMAKISAEYENNDIQI